MPPAKTKPANRESDEQSIKARKNQIFEPGTASAPTEGENRPFAAYLKHTPPAPLSATTKAALAGMGLLIVLLLIAGLLAEGPRKPSPPEDGRRVQAHSAGGAAGRAPETAG